MWFLTGISSSPMTDAPLASLAARDLNALARWTREPAHNAFPIALARRREATRSRS